MSQVKWACNLRVQRGVHLRPLARTIHIPVQVVGKRVHGVAEVTNGADEDQELVLIRTQAGTARRVPAGILAVRGVVHPAGTFEGL